MSWKDTIKNNKFKITLGNGVDFYPKWRHSSSKSTEFNTAGFDFISKKGTLVDRKEVKSSKYPIQIYFDGDDHLNEAESFELGSEDSRYWQINHPLFGFIKGHPISIERIEENQNITTFNIDFWETTLDSNQPLKIQPLTYITNKSNQIKIKEIPIIIPDASIQSNMSKSVGKVKDITSSFLDNSFYSEFSSKISNALSSIDSIITYPSGAITDLGILINLPKSLNQSISIRLKLFSEILNSFKSLFPKINENNKVVESYLHGVAIASICEVLISPIDGDYNSKADIEKSFNSLISFYTAYKDNLDEGHFSFESVFEVENIVQSTLYYLNSIIFNAKSERIIEVSFDTNLLLLTHKYLGLDADDKNLEIFRKMNNISNKKIFKIKQGSKIKFLR